MNFIVIQVLASESWSNQPKDYVLCLELENGYKSIDSFQYHLRDLIVKRANSFKTKAAPVVTAPTVSAFLRISSISY